MALDRFITLVQTRALVPAAVLEEARRALVEGGEEGSAFRLAALLVERGAIGESTAQELVAASAAPAQGGAPEGRLEGRTVGNWRVVRKISEGGMGAVYLAEHTSLERKAALKVVLDEHGGDTDALARFEQEARVLAKVRHPNIVDVIDFGRDGDRRYILMEFVDGESLEQALARRGPIPWREAAAWARDAARGLAAIHAAGLVHRDIKPSNILVDASGRVKIVDFGVVRELDRSLGLTMSGIAIGTPLYMPPEQARGRKVDARSDLYSLGATLFHLVAGESPFNAESAVGVLMKHIGERPPRAPLDRRGCPAPLAMLILKALAKEPRARPETAAELAEALEAILAGPERRAGAASAGERSQARPAGATAARRAPARRGAGAGALAGLGGAVALLALVAWLAGGSGGGPASTVAPGTPASAGASSRVAGSGPSSAARPTGPSAARPAPGPARDASKGEARSAKLTPEELLGSGTPARREPSPSAATQTPLAEGAAAGDAPDADSSTADESESPRPIHGGRFGPKVNPGNPLFAQMETEALHGVSAPPQLARLDALLARLGPARPFAPETSPEAADAALASLDGELAAPAVHARVEWERLLRRASAEAATRFADALRAAGDEPILVRYRGGSAVRGKVKKVDAREITFAATGGGEVAIAFADLTLADALATRAAIYDRIRGTLRRDTEGGALPDPGASLGRALLDVGENRAASVVTAVARLRDPALRLRVAEAASALDLVALRSELCDGSLAVAWDRIAAWRAIAAQISPAASRAWERRGAEFTRWLAWRSTKLSGTARYEGMPGFEERKAQDALWGWLEKNRIDLLRADAAAVEVAYERLFDLAPQGAWFSGTPLGAGQIDNGRFWTADWPSSSHEGEGAHWTSIPIPPSVVGRCDGVQAVIRRDACDQTGIVLDAGLDGRDGVSLYMASKFLGWTEWLAGGKDGRQAQYRFDGKADPTEALAFTIEDGALAFHLNKERLATIKWSPKHIRALSFNVSDGRASIERLSFRRAP